MTERVTFHKMQKADGPVFAVKLDGRLQGLVQTMNGVRGWYYVGVQEGAWPPVLVGQNVAWAKRNTAQYVLKDEAERLRRKALAARPWYRRLWDSIFGGAR